MSRGRRRKFRLNLNIKPETVRFIISLVLLSIAIISLISFFSPSYKLNSKVQHILNTFFGNTSILIPFVVGSFGMLFIDKINSKFKEARVFIGLFLVLFSSSGLLHVLISEEKALYVAKEGEGGGFLGYKISSILTSWVGTFGSFLLLLIIFIASLALIFNISPGNIVDFFKNNKFASEIIGNLKSIFQKKGNNQFEENESSIELDAGMINDFKEENTLGSEVYHEEPEQAPLFEIVQSMSEPQFDSSRVTVDTLVPAPSLKISSVPSDRIWNYPPYTLLAEPPARVWDKSDVDRRVKIIKDTLESFGVDVDIDVQENVKVGSSVTQYAAKPKSVTNIAKISSLQGNLALALASPTGSVRIEAPIPGKSLIGIEVPNTKRTMVYFKSLIDSEVVKNLKSKLAVVLGEDVGGKVVTYDIGSMPHLLIAGTTGSGKSIFIHNILLSILFRATPQEVKFILLDPKRVELIHYEGIPHLLTPVITEMDKAPSVFRWAVEEMEKRYKLFEQARVRNVDSYNEKSGIQVMPYILIVVDELADIMMKDPQGIEKSIIRLAQMGRATGVHLILAVQRPDKDIITGLIKANIPCRVAFQVLNQINSRVIIDQPGAEKLLGKGDMLFVPPDTMKPIRLQGAYISDKETTDVVKFLKDQGLETEYNDEVLKMPLDSSKGSVTSNWGGNVDKEFDRSVDIVISAGKASASLLQRKLSIGYARAARIIDDMESKGIVGPEVSGSRGRDVLVDSVPDRLDKYESDINSDPGYDKEDFTDEDFPRNSD